ncbi:MAG: DUF805 domain-containing protein [Leadbetterella sp.]|nr:DUF805 domain-containing protein [Leadbetterella sp.]
MEWFIKVLRQYADFDGRARRKEFWMFTLFYVVFSLFAALMDDAMDMSYTDDLLSGGMISTAYALALFIPGLAVSVRRLHDIGKSGWMILVIFIPLIGWIWLIVLHCQDSEPGSNSYGPNPKAAGPANPL